MDNKPKAIILILISALSFAIMGAMVKLAGDIPLFEKVFYRNLISLGMAFIMIKNKNVSFFGKKENQLYLFSRSILGLLGVILSFYAINYLVLSDASMLNKISPFFVTLFAIFFLKEKLTKIQIPVLIIVFIGALLIIKPQFDFSVVPSLAGFLSAMCAGATYTIIRFLRDREKPSTIVFYFSFVSVVVMFPLMMLNYQKPTMIQLLYLIGIGIFAGIAQFALTNAYRYAPASEVSIYDYTSIIFSGIIGFVIWSEVPDLLSIMGSFLIIGAAIFAFIYNGKKSLKEVN
ncbi:DMT family transporter [Clostridium lacusfryxellense]|uniref:DMT family transporter n=1 Tax=Clostridium lacusfryxellense TaxID=205328 RepID=UPI001C0E1698|nr:DMT family transporter [Clostridium lacusfryxellense]MBU3113428.1 DMT family transporter [Clostridium lacusfryxellense]